MFYVYILKSKKDDKLYIGYTNDLKRMLQEHNSGENKSTKYRLPLELIYYEAYKSKADAEKREDMLKIQGYAMGGVKRRIANSLKA